MYFNNKDLSDDILHELSAEYKLTSLNISPQSAKMYSAFKDPDNIEMNSNSKQVFKLNSPQKQAYPQEYGIFLPNDSPDMLLNYEQSQKVDQQKLEDQQEQKQMVMSYQYKSNNSIPNNENNLINKSPNNNLFNKSPMRLSKMKEDEAAHVFAQRKKELYDDLSLVRAKSLKKSPMHRINKEKNDNAMQQNLIGSPSSQRDFIIYNTNNTNNWIYQDSQWKHAQDNSSNNKKAYLAKCKSASPPNNHNHIFKNSNESKFKYSLNQKKSQGHIVQKKNASAVISPASSQTTFFQRRLSAKPAPSHFNKSQASPGPNPTPNKQIRCKSRVFAYDLQQPISADNYYFITSSKNKKKQQQSSLSKGNGKNYVKSMQHQNKQIQQKQQYQNQNQNQCQQSSSMQSQSNNSFVVTRESIGSSQTAVKSIAPSMHQTFKDLLMSDIGNLDQEIQRMESSQPPQSNAKGQSQSQYHLIQKQNVKQQQQSGQQYIETEEDSNFKKNKQLQQTKQKNNSAIPLNNNKHDQTEKANNVHAAQVQSREYFIEQTLNLLKPKTNLSKNSVFNAKSLKRKESSESCSGAVGNFGVINSSDQMNPCNNLDLLKVSLTANTNHNSTSFQKDKFKQYLQSQNKNQYHIAKKQYQSKNVQHHQKHMKVIFYNDMKQQELSVQDQEYPPSSQILQTTPNLEAQSVKSEYQNLESKNAFKNNNAIQWQKIKLQSVLKPKRAQEFKHLNKSQSEIQNKNYLGLSRNSTNLQNAIGEQQSQQLANSPTNASIKPFHSQIKEQGQAVQQLTYSTEDLSDQRPASMKQTAYKELKINKNLTLQQLAHFQQMMLQKNQQKLNKVSYQSLLLCCNEKHPMNQKVLVQERNFNNVHNKFEDEMDFKRFNCNLRQSYDLCGERVDKDKENHVQKSDAKNNVKMANTKNNNVITAKKMKQKKRNENSNQNQLERKFESLIQQASKISSHLSKLKLEEEAFNQ